MPLNTLNIQVSKADFRGLRLEIKYKLRIFRTHRIKTAVHQGLCPCAAWLSTTSPASRDSVQTPTIKDNKDYPMATSALLLEAGQVAKKIPLMSTLKMWPIYQINAQ